MTSGPVRRRESIPAPLHESAGPAGTAGLVGPGLGTRRRGGRDTSIPTTVLNTCTTP